MKDCAADLCLEIEYGPGRVRFAPDVGLAIAPNFAVLQAALKTRIPAGYDYTTLRLDQFDILRPNLAGRQFVRILDGGDTQWGLAVEKLVLGMNGKIEPLPPVVALTRADSIETKPVAWLWRDWLAKGKLHILAGAPGTGKTTLALALAAIVSANHLPEAGTDNPKSHLHPLWLQN